MVRAPRFGLVHLVNLPSVTVPDRGPQTPDRDCLFNFYAMMDNSGHALIALTKISYFREASRHSGNRVVLFLQLVGCKVPDRPQPPNPST